MQLRKWQKAALERLVSYRRTGKSHALIAACPGAGKTQFTVAAWCDPEVRGECDVVLVVVPSRALKRQWKKSFERSGVGAIADVPNDHLEERAYRDDEMFDPSRPVQIFTYAQIAANPDLFRILSDRHRVFVVFDEIHHADDDEAFGKALVHAFDGANFKLSLSGTPFNTKAGRLAFCETREVADDAGRRVRQTVADFAYSYADALSAEGSDDDPDVVRPVQFVRWNGLAKWQRTYVETGATLEQTTTGGKKTDPLWPLLAIDGANSENARRMIDAALARLEEIRQHQSNAAMLITAMDRDHCEQIAEYLRTKGVHDVKIIMHDTPRAADAIRDFEVGRDRVLIAIKMISEGVDIKRLRVGVYASNVLTQMFFIQFIGRFIRWDASLPAHQYACVFIPEHVVLIRYALEIERMVIESEHALGGDGKKREGVDRPESVVTGLTSTGAHNGIIERSQNIEQQEADRLREAIRRAGFAGSEGEARRLLDAMRQLSPGFAPQEDVALPEPDESRKNDKLVAAIVRASEKAGRPLTYADVNGKANAAVGINRKDALTSQAVLRQRAEYLKRLLAMYWGDPDAAA